MYVFDLPAALASSLVLRTADADEPEAPPPSAEAPGAPRTPAAVPGQAPACTLCPGSLPFASVLAQRSHYRSLWHRYNLVLRQHGARDTTTTPALVTREELERQCAEMEAEAEARDDADDTIDELTGLLQRLQLPSQNAPDDEASARSVSAAHEALRSPLVWYETPASAPTHWPQTQFGIYRDVLLAAAGEKTAPSAWLPRLDTPRLEVRPGQHGWPGKRLQGTHGVGRGLQLQVLDGMGLVPWLTRDDLTGAHADDDETSSDSEVSSSTEDDDDDAAAPPAAPLPPLRLWTFVMLGGGHFAIATVALNLHVTPLSERARARGTKPTRSIVVLAHKTFHRYTTRRKQGGAQSAQDSSGKHAKSAGANLRRYGEQQLHHDIHELLQRRGWKELIERSEHVWVRTSMRSAHGVLWRWPGAAVSPLDAKQASGHISHIPIATQRPTISEIMRCFLELTRVKIAHLTPDELAAQDDARRDKLARALRLSATQHAPPPPPPRTRPARKDESEARQRERWERLVTMVRKGKHDALDRFLTRHQAMLAEQPRPPAWEHAAWIDAPLPAWWRAAEARTTAHVPANLLQLAAAADQAALVQYLLVERRADPTLPVHLDDSSAPHRTAYDLSGGKATRAVFRRLMAEQPTWYRWDEMGAGGARVPSALTADMEEAQASKARSRRNALREKMREREAKAQADAHAAEQAAAQAKADARAAPAATAASRTPGAQRLGGRDSAAASAGLSEEMQRRIEREKRARAAEARMLRK